MKLLSASGISLWRECQRKWAWRYVARLPSPPNKSARLGIEVDEQQLQPHLRDGQPFDFSKDSGYIAASGLEYLPAPKSPGLEVQKHFVLPREGFAFQGYMDLWLPDSSAVPGLPGGAPVVVDFKTTGDLKWQKSEDVLRKDVQAQLYAAAGLAETGAEEIDLAWIYFQTRGTRKARRTYIRVGKEHVARELEGIEHSAREILAAQGVNPLTLPPTPSQCEAYGGCPYRDKCNLSPAQYLEALEPEVNMSTMMDRLRAKKAAAEEKAGEQSPAGGTAVSPAPAAAADAAEPPPSPPQPLGINPPEKDLPPPEPTAAKRGPGRPKKAQPDPIAADFAMAASPGARITVTSYVPDGPTVVIQDSARDGETIVAALARLGVQSTAKCDPKVSG